MALSTEYNTASTPLYRKTTLYTPSTTSIDYHVSIACELSWCDLIPIRIRLTWFQRAVDRRRSERHLFLSLFLFFSTTTTTTTTYTQKTQALFLRHALSVCLFLRE